MPRNQNIRETAQRRLFYADARFFRNCQLDCTAVMLKNPFSRRLPEYVSYSLSI